MRKQTLERQKPRCYDFAWFELMPIYKEEDVGSYRPVSPTSVLGKVMELITLSAITGHIQDNHRIRPFRRG